MSQKIKSSLEVFAGLVFVFGYLWFISPLHSLWIHVLTLVTTLSFFIYSDLVNKRNLKEMGFSLDNWFGSSKILLVFTLTAIPVLYLIWQNYFPVNNFFYKEFSFWKKIVTTPLWPLFQEYIFLAFFFRRYREIFFPHTSIAIFFSALTFAMIHIPNPPLVILCFAAGIVWAYTYNKYPNLFTIAISHAVLGIFCSNVLLVYPLVGPNADIGRWSSGQVPAYAYIDRVDTIVPYKDNKVADVNINHEKNSISVDGWVASTNKIKSVRISFGGKDYSVHYGSKREDVAAYFNNPDFTYSGFNARIPISDFSPGYHKLFLKVYLEGKRFYNTAGAKIWVKLI
jgi:membrane protease YdiL (CAAX protease family)